METENSLNHSIDSATKHYSSMFSLPSFKTALAAVAALCLVIGFSTLAVSPSLGLIDALTLSLSLFVLTLVGDLVMSKGLLRGDPVFSLRRTLVVSLVGWGLWLVFTLLGVLLSFVFGWLIWVQLSLLGYAVVITLRIIVLTATSAAANWKKGMCVLLQPALAVVAFLVFWAGTSSTTAIQAVPFIVVAPVVGFVAVYLFFYSIERLSQKAYSMSSLPLFRAFIVDWVSSQNAPLEKCLEEMGQNASIEVSLLKFDASKPKAAIIVPLVHPGPFKNIGSSLLPSMLKVEFEKEYGCDACTPLGILGHELDLASQEQNRKIVSQVIASAKFEATANLASPLVRATEGAAIACCQIFGDIAFLSFTLAPETTEDLPQELGRFVSEEATKYGLKSILVVNTHNCLTDVIDTAVHLDELKAAASKCLQKAVDLPTKPFMVGAATVVPKEFTLKEGMGTGGVTATVVEVDEQKMVYIVIDGNNMILNLREKIIAALASEGFDESEVLTTDTHAVTALITGRHGHRGYHPVGEAMDNNLLIQYICEAAKKAAATLEASRAGFVHFVVPDVRVIGEARLKSMTTLVDKTIQRAKQILTPIFGVEGLTLILLLLVLLH